MEYASYKAVSNNIHESYVQLATQYFWNKSEGWIEDHVLKVAYEKEVYNFIISTCAAIHLTERLSIYDVAGHWQLITKIEHNGNTSHP